MNARDNTPLRTLIAAHLDEAGECTALAIAKAVGKGDVPSVVVKELNAMRTDGQVECEQRKKEMLYWLAVPLAQIAGGTHEAPAAPASDLPAGVREGTRAAQIYRTLPKFGAAPMTAREIATATGCAKGLIAPVLTAMDKAGQVTRIPAGVEGGGLYGYTRLPPAGGDIDIQNAQPEVAKNTGSSASGSLSPSEGAAVQSKPAPVAAATPSAAPVAADVQPQTAEIPPQITPEIPPTEAEDDAMPPADASLLALANRELADRLARVAHVLRGSGLEGLKDLDDGADLQTAAAALTGAYQMALVEPAMLRGELAKADADLQQIHTLLAHRVAGPIDPSDLGEVECAEKAADMIDEATDEISRLLSLLGEERAARQALQEQIDELQRAAMRGASLLSGSDRYTAAGYLVRTPKRKPRITTTQETAVAAALAAARNGSGRGEVFALVPVGKAVRGAEWRPA